jgi:hypothetical protein
LYRGLEQVKWEDLHRLHDLFVESMRVAGMSSSIRPFVLSASHLRRRRTDHTRELFRGAYD